MFGVVHHRLPVVSAVSKVSIFAASEVRREAIGQRSCNRVATRLTECLFLGVKRTSPTALHMSAFDPKADIRQNWVTPQVRLVSATTRRSISFGSRVP